MKEIKNNEKFKKIFALLIIFLVFQVIFNSFITYKIFVNDIDKTTESLENATDANNDNESNVEDSIQGIESIDDLSCNTISNCDIDKDYDYFSNKEKFAEYDPLLEDLQYYENPRYGYSFQFSSNWFLDSKDEMKIYDNLIELKNGDYTFTIIVNGWGIGEDLFLGQDFEINQDVSNVDGKDLLRSVVGDPKPFIAIYSNKPQSSFFGLDNYTVAIQYDVMYTENREGNFDTKTGKKALSEMDSVIASFKWGDKLSTMEIKDWNSE